MNARIRQPTVPWLVRVAAVVVALAVLVILPQQSTPYDNLQITLVAAWAVVIAGLNLLTGYAGQISLGQAAFFGIGAYTTAITALHGWPVVLSFALAFLLPATVGALVAIPAVRLRGHALAMITISLPLVAVPLAKRLDGLTGGSQGLTTPIGSAPTWSGLADDQWAYYVVLTVAAALLALAHVAVRGRTGRALSLIRTSEVAAVTTGIPVRRYKMVVFALASGYGGAGGFLYVYCVRFVSPESLDFLLGITLLCSLVVGGLRSSAGSVVAACFYVYVPNLVGDINPEKSSLIYGAVLLLVLLFAPAGIAGAARGLWRRRKLLARKLATSWPAPSTPTGYLAVAGSTETSQEENGGLTPTRSTASNPSSKTR
ncbi:branched-chain amino acid ABC transporter permease [Parafrankia sp. EUN1f]|uniref:branched-chain amino acid ABC transporter permease n=1 Tax=Parafrankia sp. EUN1f TaxID=102897 RepID=UPI0001C467FC|nr:branched-chain amino acid ABC transporter permease [Parafrankia sp. EUN1f]EFC80993.1 inner-membrane translocator [Parafrankia sp. EUN1f]